MTDKSNTTNNHRGALNSINMSHWNENVDFSELKENNIIGVIHKATEGATFVDPKYAEDRNLAEAEDLLWGAYHVGTNDPVSSQVSNFLNTIGSKRDNVIMSLNLLDRKENSMTTAQAEQFLRDIENSTHHKPLVYGSYFHLNDLSSPTLNEYPLWFARFSDDSTPPLGWKEWKMWHYTDGKEGPEPHKVGDISINRDEFNGTKIELEQFWNSF